MAKGKLGINFNVEPPKQDRSSRYQELYDALREGLKPGEWADVTDAVQKLASESDSGKVPSPQATAVTLRKNRFAATARGDRVFAGIPDDDSGE